MPSNIALAIVIATYNRAEFLSYCFDSLLHQTVGRDFQLIVVNNNSTDATEKIVSAYAAEFPHFTSIFESRQGASYARNSGVAAAKAEWVAFLDDDAKPHDDWLQHAVEVIQSNDFDAFGGPYLAWHHFGPPPSWFSKDWETTIAVQPWYGPVRPKHFPTSGNCFAKKSCILNAGGFPTTMGPQGKNFAYGEETALFAAMRQNGARVGWVPDLLVDHCVQPYKYSMRWRLFSCWRHGRDGPSSLRLPGTLGNVGAACWHLAKSAFSAPFKALAKLAQYRDYRWQRCVVEGLGPILYNYGTLCGLLLRWREDKRRPRPDSGA